MSDHGDWIRQTIEFISIDEAQRETVAALEALLAERDELAIEVVTLCAAIREAGFEPVKAQRSDGSPATVLLPTGTPGACEPEAESATRGAEAS